MKSLCTVVVGVAFGLAAVLSTEAKEVKWSGGAGVGEDGIYDWNEPANWEGNALPVEGDIPVFSPTGTLVLKAAGKTGVSYTFKGLKFTSGKTYITTGTYFYLRTAKTVAIHVADGALASLTNHIDTYTNDGVVLQKTGGGTFEAQHVGTDNAFAEVDVQEGVLGGVNVASWRSMRSKAYRVRNGATLALPGADWLGTVKIDDVNVRPDLHVEAGGTVKAGGMVRVGNLTGAGEICGYSEGAKNNSWQSICVYPSEDAVFSGQVWTCFEVSSASVGRFILGRADTLAHCYRVTGSRIGFVPGLTGTIRLGESFSDNTYYRPEAGYPLHLADTNGAPVAVAAQFESATYAANLETTGPGSFYTLYASTTFKGNKLKHTGALGNATASTTLTLGDGTAANDVDITRFSKLDAKTGAITVNNSSALTYNGDLCGEAKVTFLNDVVLGNVNFTGEGAVIGYGDIAMTGGDFRGAYSAISIKTDGKAFMMTGGKVRKQETLDASQSICALPAVTMGCLLPNFVGTSTVSGGEFYLDAYQGLGSKFVELLGGKVIVVKEQLPRSDATAADPTVLKLNGGSVCVRFYDTSSQNNVSPFPDNVTYRVCVGEKGGSLRQTGLYNAVYNHSATIKPTISSGVESGKDGGLAQYGYAPVSYLKPLEFTGPFRVVGGYACLPDTVTPPADQPFFGRGDLELANGVIQVIGRAATMSNPLKIATASGATLRYEGGSAIRTCGTYDGFTPAGSAAQSVEIGAVERGIGGVLYISDVSRNIGEDGSSAVKVNGGVAVHPTNGRVLQPIVGIKSNVPYFLGYDATDGFKPLSGVKTDLASSTADDVVEFTSPSAGWTGFRTQLTANALFVKPSTTIYLYNTAGLTVGDGVNPAVVLMRGGSISSEGQGGVKFGTAEGVIVCGGDSDAGISAPIQTANGMTYAGFPDFRNASTRAKMTVSGVNTYSGVTRIGCLRLFAQSEKCFSSGDVYISDGERFGGQVRFNLKGGTWDNNFHVAGWGTPDSIWNDRTSRGALFFAESGMVAGKVELTAEAMVCVGADVTGTISGTVSGDRLRVFDAPGILRLTGSNTYAGGTEVATATLELAKGASAGTGTVLLNNGTLRFVNDAPIVFTNRIEGIGRIEVAGTGSVKFTDASLAALPYKDLAPGAAFDWPSLGNATWCVNVGAEGLDLGGKDVTLAGIAGSGRVSGGTVTVTGEINPGGIGAIGTLTFDRAPVTAGATLVAEVSGATADKLVVEDDIGLSALALRVVGLTAKVGPGTATIVQATGLRTGEFASVVKTPKKMERRALEYGVSDVRICLDVGLMMIVR